MRKCLTDRDGGKWVFTAIEDVVRNTTYIGQLTRDEKPRILPGDSIIVLGGDRYLVHEVNYGDPTREDYMIYTGTADFNFVRADSVVQIVRNRKLLWPMA